MLDEGWLAKIAKENGDRKAAQDGKAMREELMRRKY